MTAQQRLYRQKANTPPCFRITDAISEQEINALRACERGEATGNQQQLALRCILVKLSGLYDQPYVPGEPDQTQFRAGRSFVGHQMQKLLKVDIDILLGGEHET